MSVLNLTRKNLIGISFPFLRVLICVKMYCTANNTVKRRCTADLETSRASWELRIRISSPASVSGIHKIADIIKKSETTMELNDFLDSDALDAYKKHIKNSR